MGCGERVRDGRKVAARYGQGGRGLKEFFWSDAAVVSCGERERGGREVATGKIDRGRGLCQVRFSFAKAWEVTPRGKAGL